MDSPEKDRFSTPETARLRAAYVVFADIVSYSLMATDEQSRAVHHLQSIVRELPGFAEELAAGELICISAGDGMAIVCFGEPTAPVRYARDLAVRIKREAPFGLRIGLHNGPVYCSADINANPEIGGWVVRGILPSRGILASRRPDGGHPNPGFATACSRGGRGGIA